MDDYISRQAARKTIRKYSRESDMPDDWHQGLLSAVNILKDVPSADVVEVVRCKDCRHYTEEGKTTRYAWCHKWKNAVNFSDFCSYGERAEQ